MRKSAFAAGAFLLAFCVGLSSGVKGQSNELSEFIKLLNEAENSFLDMRRSMLASSTRWSS